MVAFGVEAQENFKKRETPTQAEPDDMKQIWVKLDGIQELEDQLLLLPSDTPIATVFSKYYHNKSLDICLAATGERLPWTTTLLPLRITEKHSAYSIECPEINEHEQFDKFFVTLHRYASAPPSDLRLENFYKRSTTILVDHNSSIRLVRTVRLPENGKHYDLPLGFGTLPLFKVDEFAGKLPTHMVEKGGLIAPMHQHEAMFLSFDFLSYGRPGYHRWESSHPAYAIRPFVGGINAITGDPFIPNMRSLLKQRNKIPRKQDYVVVRPNPAQSQQWLDGVRTAKGIVRQFIAVDSESVESIEHQVTGRNDVGGLQLEITPTIRFGNPNLSHSIIYSRIEIPMSSSSRQIGLTAGQFIYYEPVDPQILQIHDMLNPQKLRETTILDALNLARSLHRERGLSSSEPFLHLGPYSPITDPLELKFNAGHRGSHLWTVDRNWQYREIDNRVMWCMRWTSHAVAVFDSVRINYNETFESLLMEDGDKIDLMPEQVGGGCGEALQDELTLGAGAQIRQHIVSDVIPPHLWHKERSVLLNIQIVDARHFKQLTGLSPPDLPIQFVDYVKKQYGWLESQDSTDILHLGQLSSIKPVTISTSPDLPVVASHLSTNRDSSTFGQDIESEKPKVKRRKIEVSCPYPGFCQACSTPFRDGARYSSCGHIICENCDPNKKGPNIANSYLEGIDMKNWKCLLCSSRGCTRVVNEREVRATEMDRMCERFESIVDPSMSLRSTKEHVNDRDIPSLL